MRLIPAALAALTAYPQWGLCQLVPRPDGRTDKVPVNPQTLRNCDAHDSTLWLTADAALQRLAEVGEGYCLRFTFTESDPFAFIDADNCYTDDWSPLAKELCARFTGAAVEVSQSGRGLHIFFRADLSSVERKCKGDGFDLYTEGRFVALTGTNAIGDAGIDHSAAARALVTDYLQPDTAAPKDANWTTAPRADWNGPTDDDDLLSRVLNSGSASAAFGGKASFSALWNADPEALARAFPPDQGGDGYDESRADSALAFHLAFWTGCDCERIERLMLRSGLAREKWTKRKKYLRDTILKACSMTQNVIGDAVAPLSVDHDPDLSHDALALNLSQRAGWAENARYVKQFGRWLFFDGVRWQVDERLSHLTQVRAYLRQVATDLKRWAAQTAAQETDTTKAEKLVGWANAQARGLRQAQTVAAVETTARSNAELAASADQFDGNLLLLGTPGGTVDLETGEMRESRRDDYITRLTAVVPAPPSTPAPLWDAFLHRVLAGDPELTSFLQRLAGYSLTGLTTEHKLFFLYGAGRNGKSTFLEMLTWLWSEYATRAPAAAFLDTPHERHPTDMAGLRGARLVIGSELPAGKSWNESAIKDMTGGDTIRARFMRQDFFSYEPHFTLMIAGNHRPSLRTVDEAMRSRVVLIPFTVTIPEAERDRDLKKKLKAEGPAILRWAIDGAVAWRRDGLAVPESVRRASSEYLDSEDLAGEFIAESLERCEGQNVSTSAVYTAFRSWCANRGLHQPWSMKALTQALKDHGLPYRRTNSAREFAGYRLRLLSALTEKQ